MVDMKKDNIIIGIILSSVIWVLVGVVPAFAQTVYSCRYKSDADVVVYVADYKSQADLVVYKCGYRSDASGNKGLWYFVDQRSSAKKKIYFTEYRSDADLVVYFATYKSDAGWKNKSKEHLLY
jgi:hypothetical protein